MRWIVVISLAVMALGLAGCEVAGPLPQPLPVPGLWQELALELAPLPGEALDIASFLEALRLQPVSIERDMQAAGSALGEALGAVKRKNAAKLREWLLEAKERLGAAVEELSKQDRRWFDLEALFSRALELSGRVDGLLKRVPL